MSKWLGIKSMNGTPSVHTYKDHQFIHFPLSDPKQMACPDAFCGEIVTYITERKISLGYIHVKARAGKSRWWLTVKLIAANDFLVAA